MNTYLIQQKVESFSEIHKHNIFSVSNYTFEDWKYEYLTPRENAWLVHKEIKANNINEAIKTFEDGLIPILNIASFVSQCGIQYKLNSIFVLRKNNNSENIFFMQASNISKESTLSFQTEEKESLEILMKMDNKVVFDFLHASNLSMTNHGRLTPMILAIEAIAGEKEISETCSCGKVRRYQSTDKVKIKQILGDELNDMIYKHKIGLRNKLFHGKTFELGDRVDYAQRIYEKIISFFNKESETKISTDVVGAPRNGLGKYSGVQLLAKPKSNNIYTIDLRTMLPLFNEKESNSYLRIDQSNFNQNFEILPFTNNPFWNNY